jgi:quercetin dioxygenase-like cupin family protein
MEVLSGRMIFYLDGKELVTSAGDPPLLIPRGHVHGFTVSM